MGDKRRLRGTSAAVTCLAAALTMFSVAGAAAATYPSDPASRGFSGGQAGWTASSTFDGACVPPLLCPTVTNSFQPSDGADGGGFIRSAYTGVAGVTAVGGTSTGVWQSPPFKYGGDKDGAQAVFEMDRRSSVDQLLAVSGNSATYSVRLIDVTDGGSSLDLIAPTTLAGANSWRGVSAPVDTGKLVKGDEYRFAITSTYVTGTSVVVTGSADYDNVGLTVGPAARAGGRGGGGSGGSGGSGGGLDGASLATLLRGATPGTAIVKGRGRTLLVPVKCPRKVHRACRMTVQGLLRRRKAATTRRSVKVGKGKYKLLKLRVKPKFRRRVAKRKRLLVKQRVRAGKVKATVVKSRRLIRR